MKQIDVVKAWKDKEYRASLSAEQLASLPENPVGEPLSDLEASLTLGGVTEPAALELLPSSGWVCTISGECSASGRCCNPFSSYLPF